MKASCPAPSSRSEDWSPMTHEHWLQEPSRAEKRIIFARHGEYPSNVRSVCNSDPRIGYFLTEKGVAQAEALAERLSGEKIELIVTSEFQRARHTAWIVNQKLRVPQVVNRLANENRVGRCLRANPARIFSDSSRTRRQSPRLPKGRASWGFWDESRH